MGKIILIVVLFLGVPSSIFFFLNDALATQEREWSDEVLKEYSLAVQQKFTLPFVCNSPEVNRQDFSPVCNPYRNTKHLRSLALGTALTPVIYSLLLIALSFACKADRALLLRVFRPGIWLSNILVATLLLLQWLLIAGVMYGYSFGKPTEDDYFWIVLLGIVAAVGAFFIMKPLLKGVPRAKTTVLGLQLSQKEYPTIWNFVTSLAAQAGARPPDHLVVGFTPNFFVTEATVTCISGTLDGATMYLSLPICRILSTNELTAVVLHELAHFKGEDAAFSVRFYPIYRGVSESLYGVANASARIANIGSYIPITQFRIIFLIASLFLLPSVYLLRFFFDSFSRVENQIGRDRELAADALAARIEGPDAIANALVKLAAFSSIWDDLTEWAKKAQSDGIVKLGESQYEPNQFFFNMSSLFCAMVQDNANPDRLQGLDSIKTSHPTDTHPPLSVRLAALQTSLADTAHRALVVEIENPSSNLIENVEDLEINLSEFQRTLATA